MSKVTFNTDGSKAEFDTTISYDKAGTYFPTVRVYSQRTGNNDDKYTYIPNLARVRVVVK